MKNILTPKLSKYYLQGVGNIAILNAQRNANQMIDHFFAPINVLASKPVYTYRTDKVIVNVFYYMPVKNHALNNNTINNLGDVLSQMFVRKVELRLVKLHYPYLNSSILAQLIRMNVSKYNFNQVLRMIFSKTPIVKQIDSNNRFFDSSILPSHIVGIKIRISGRLITERIRPRQTVLTGQIGSFVKDNQSFIDFDSFTSKNFYGAFTVKVWISQRFMK